MDLGSVASDERSEPEILSSIVKTRAEKEKYVLLRCVSYKDNVANDEARNRINDASGKHDDPLTTMKKRKLRSYGHISLTWLEKRDRKRDKKKKKKAEEEVKRQHWLFRTKKNNGEKNLIASVWKERAIFCYRLLVIMWFLFRGVSSSSWWVLEIGIGFVLWHSLAFLYNYFDEMILIFQLVRDLQMIFNDLLMF